jgi:hypothetical protein
MMLPLSNLAFKFNLRRYNVVCVTPQRLPGESTPSVVVRVGNAVGPGRYCSPRHPSHLQPSFF